MFEGTPKSILYEFLDNSVHERFILPLSRHWEVLFFWGGILPFTVIFIKSFSQLFSQQLRKTGEETEKAEKGVKSALDP
jgi:hypothetical protein